jgi:hypothetical protein
MYIIICFNMINVYSFAYFQVSPATEFRFIALQLKEYLSQLTFNSARADGIGPSPVASILRPDIRKQTSFLTSAHCLLFVSFQTV